MLDRLLFILTQKLAIFFVAGLSIAGGFLASVSGNHTAPSQTAIISGDTTIAATMAIMNLPDVPPGLLPSTTLPFCTPSSTCGTKNIAFLLKLSSGKKSAPPSIVSASIMAKTMSASDILKPPTAGTTPTTPTSPKTLQPMTAQGLVNNIKLTFQESRTGPYQITVNTTGPNGEILSWNIGATTVGGVASIPKFTTGFSCNPSADIPTSDSPDQNPIFQTDSTYNCTVSITPTTGADLRTQSKVISFTTPGGQLFVARATTMATVLTNDTNDGGIVFDNQDKSPVTITGLTFDVSYTALNTLDKPLVFRVLDPATNQSLFDYHLENAAKDPIVPYTNDQANITVPVSITVKGMTQKMIPVEVLGVERMLMPGINPTVVATLRSATIDRTDVKVNINSPKVLWSCVVAIGGYDPNATSDAFATGQACRD